MAGKIFNYRMHPENFSALVAAKISYSGLANNYTFNFSKEGLEDTIAALEKSSVAFTGAGPSQEGALAPVLMSFAGSSKNCVDRRSPVPRIGRQQTIHRTGQKSLGLASSTIALGHARG